LAREYRIYGVRVPRDSSRWRGQFPCDGFAQKYALSLLARLDAFALGGNHVRTCQGAAGIFDSGVLNEERLLAILDRLPEGATELVCHPGSGDAESKAMYGHWRYGWQNELEALTSDVVRARLQERQIRLISYAELGTPG
jgi:predicted glycoside hydrolase/deacetylase ChbG (UPF0249 family)